jgi:hypothetical protein
MRPATTALLDQASAAATETTAVMHALALQGPGRLAHTEPGPVTKTVVKRMQDRMLTVTLSLRPTLCEHLSYRAPKVAFWPAYAPGRLRCPRCAQAVVNRIRGTREDNRCDGCRKHTRRIHPDAVQLPPLVVDLAPMEAVAIPPVIVLFGLCPACQQIDTEGRAAA